MRVLWPLNVTAARALCALGAVAALAATAGCGGATEPVDMDNAAAVAASDLGADVVA